MKKHKKLLSLILTVLLLLTACGTVPPDPTNTEPTKATEATEYIPPFATRPIETYPDPATTEMKIGCQYLPETVDNPDNLPVLKWVCLMSGSDGSVWNETAAIEVNQMLADRNMPFRVQFVIYTTDYPFFENMDWFVRPEAQADMATADLLYVHSISAERAENYYMPLTEYAKGSAAPSLINAVPHEINWQQTSVNGEVYGISQTLCNVYSGGWVVDSDVFTKYGLTIEDFQTNYWEIDETLKKLNEASGIRPLIEIPDNSDLSGSKGRLSVFKIYPGIAGYPMDAHFTGIGSVYAVNYVNNVPAVVNMLDTETTDTIRDAIIRYREKYAAQDIRSAKLYFKLVTTSKPIQKANAATGEAYWEIPVLTPFYDASESVIMQNCSGVSASSKHQKEAVTMLSLIAEDEEFRMQLMYGKEGRDYTIDANGNYSRTKQEDGSFYHMSFLSPWSYFTGMKGSISYLPQYEGMTVLESYRHMLENAEPYYAVPFDFSGLQEELIAVQQTCQLYFYRFASLTEEKYEEMLNKINAAGGEKIMKELQSQLDAWVKANPGKPVTPRA